MDRAAYMREYRRLHPERERAAKARYWAAHKDAINVTRRATRKVIERTPRRLTDPESRFWVKVEKTDGCWLWTAGQAGRAGELYGQMRWRGGVARYAHRIAYELLVGPIPAGLQLDHLCRNHLCVNPYHLEPVTNAENVRRGVAARKALAA